MSEDDPAARTTEAMSAYFVGDLSVGDALQKICQAALDAVEPAALAGVSMTVDARMGTYVFTHPEVQVIDRPQYDTGDGPCVEAFRTGVPTIIVDTSRPGPFAEFRRVAVQHGMGSVVSVPMSTGAAVVGALNLYAPDPEAFGLGTVEVVSSFATQAAFLLRNHQAYWDARSLSENLEQAMASRAQIEQAKGVIMASTGCTADEAFAQLRAQSQHENLKLRDIAAEIVSRTARRGR